MEAASASTTDPLSLHFATVDHRVKFPRSDSVFVIAASGIFASRHRKRRSSHFLVKISYRSASPGVVLRVARTEVIVELSDSFPCSIPFPLSIPFSPTLRP